MFALVCVVGIHFLLCNSTPAVNVRSAVFPLRVLLAVFLCGVSVGGEGFGQTNIPIVTPESSLGLPVASNTDVALWFRADTGVKTNAAGLVETWADQSGK